MLFGEMGAWTKRINEVRAIKDSYIQRQRMRNLRSDFQEAYEYEEIQKDPHLLVLSEIVEQEYFALV